MTQVETETPRRCFWAWCLESEEPSEAQRAGVARTLSDGKNAANQAALVKDLGTTFEQESVGVLADLLDQSPTPEWVALLATAWPHKPLFTLRGGTNEVLRGVIARGMGLR